MIDPKPDGIIVKPRYATYEDAKFLQRQFDSLVEVCRSVERVQEAKIAHLNKLLLIVATAGCMVTISFGIVLLYLIFG